MSNILLLRKAEDTAVKIGDYKDKITEHTSWYIEPKAVKDTEDKIEECLLLSRFLEIKTIPQ